MEQFLSSIDSNGKLEEVKSKITGEQLGVLNYNEEFRNLYNTTINFRNIEIYVEPNVDLLVNNKDNTNYRIKKSALKELIKCIE